MNGSMAKKIRRLVYGTRAMSPRYRKYTQNAETKVIIADKTRQYYQGLKKVVTSDGWLG